MKCKTRAHRCQFDLIKKNYELPDQLIARPRNRFNARRVIERVAVKELNYAKIGDSQETRKKNYSAFLHFCQ